MRKKFLCHKFRLESMKKNRNILVIGKPGKGKSHLLKMLLHRFRNDYDYCIMHVGSGDTKKEFSAYLVPCFIRGEFDKGTMKNQVDLGELFVELGKDRPSLTITDDLAFDPSFFRFKPVKKVSMNGRHLKNGQVHCVQYVMCVDAKVRGLFHYVFAFGDNVRENINKLYKLFFGMFDTFSDFKRVFDEFTQNKECLVLDATNDTNELEKSVFYYKAPKNIPKFRFGNPIYWNKYEKFRTQGKRPSDKIWEKMSSKKTYTRAGALCSNNTDIERIENEVTIDEN